MKMNMGKAILCIVMVCLFILIVAVLFFTHHAAKYMAYPEGNTLAEEEAWEKEHGLWGDYDNYEKVEYIVKGYQDYGLHIELVKNPIESTKYVIISHGFRSNRYGAVKYLDAYIHLGYNCILYDMRGHGENEKTVVSLGQFESEDLEKLVKDSYSRYGDDIELGLHGESMGAATSLSLLAKNPEVDFVVADCGFSNLYDLIYTGYRKEHLGILVPFINWNTKVFFGYDMKKSSPKDAVKENRIPICFIHGSEDLFILPENSLINQKSDKGSSELHFVPGAGHAESREVLGEEGYRKIIEEFLKNLVL